MEKDSIISRRLRTQFFALHALSSTMLQRPATRAKAKSLRCHTPE